MREIKFRGIRVDNGEWVYGYYVVVEKDHIDEGRRHYIVTPACFLSADDCCPNRRGMYTFQREVIPETVGQSIGLKASDDKTEVYQGDIMQQKKSEWRFVVEWSDFRARYILQGIGNVLKQDIGFCEVCERVGNIHQNPEILK